MILAQTDITHTYTSHPSWLAQSWLAHQSWTRSSSDRGTLYRYVKTGRGVRREPS